MSNIKCRIVSNVIEWICNLAPKRFTWHQFSLSKIKCDIILISESFYIFTMHTHLSWAHKWHPHVASAFANAQNGHQRYAVTWELAFQQLLFSHSGSLSLFCYYSFLSHVIRRRNFLLRFPTTVSSFFFGKHLQYSMEHFK